MKTINVEVIDYTPRVITIEKSYNLNTIKRFGHIYTGETSWIPKLYYTNYPNTDNITFNVLGSFHTTWTYKEVQHLSVEVVHPNNYRETIHIKFDDNEEPYIEQLTGMGIPNHKTNKRRKHHKHRKHHKTNKNRKRHKTNKNRKHNKTNKRRKRNKNL